MRDVGLAWRLLRRDWVAGEMRILALAIVVAVTSITAVGFFTDRIGQVLALNANELLGGDLIVTGAAPLPGTLREQAAREGIDATQTVEFPSMALVGNRHELAAVKAVDAHYPLRGKLRISTELFAPDRVSQDVPAPGTVWLESRLLSALNVDVGDVVELGEASLKVGAVLTNEPARAAGNLFSIAPRLLMNLADLPATKLITPASRVRYSVLFAGTPEQIGRFRKAIDNSLARGQRIQGIEDARPEIRSALNRANRFLGLAALVSVLLASVAVTMATRRFVNRHLDNCAILRCLGARQNSVMRIYVMQMLVLGAGASLVGLLFGFLGQSVLVSLLGTLAKVELPAPTWRPAILGTATGFVALLGFAVPPLLQLKNVPTMRVLRRELGAQSTSSIGGYVFGLGLLATLIVWQAGSFKLGGIVLLGLAATIGVLTVLSLLLLRLVRRYGGGIGVAWRFGINNLTRRAKSSGVQIVGFGLGLMALLLLSVVRGDLLGEWVNKVPPETPNRFLINIQPQQADAVREFLAAKQENAPTLFPMVRGRLVAINDRQVDDVSFGDERAKRLVAREFNLSWGTVLQPDNAIVAGQWWGENVTEANVLSVEQGLAEELKLAMGDALTFQVGGERFTAHITNLRTVDWDSFRVNFFVIAPPALLEGYPATFITSFYLPEDEYRLLNTLLKTFPNVTIIDVAAIMAQVRRIIERVSQAIEYVFLFTILAGLLVLYAAIQSTLDERIRESAIVRTLGGARQQILKGLVAEFLALGILAGAVAAAAATTIGYVLAEHVFELHYTFNAWLWVIGLGGGGLVVGTAGTLGTRTILNQPPLQILRSN